jgi:hypothetical protein
LPFLLLVDGNKVRCGNAGYAIFLGRIALILGILYSPERIRKQSGWTFLIPLAPFSLPEEREG